MVNNLHPAAGALTERIQPETAYCPPDTISSPLRHVFTDENGDNPHGVARRNGEWVPVYRFSCSCGQRHALVWESGEEPEAELRCHVCQRVNVVVRP